MSGAPSAGPEIPLRAAPPHGSLRLKKRAVLILVISLASVTGLVVLQAFSPKSLPTRATKDDRKPSFLGPIVQSLPDDYSEVRRNSRAQAETKSASVAVLASHERGVDPAAKLAEEQRASKQKQALAARAADVSFNAALHPQQVITSSRHESSPPAAVNLALPGGMTPSTRDEDNRQDDKTAFLRERRSESSYLLHSQTSPASPYQLMAGTIIPGVLITGVNSDLPGQLLGQVSQDVYDSVHGRHRLVPQGSKLVGEYDSRISYGQERVLVVWTRMLFPNGDSITLEGMPGVDLSGYAGLHERVNNHYLKLATGVVFGSFLAAGAQMARGSNQSVDPSFGQLALEGAAQNINEAGQQITRKNLNLQPTLEISPGQRFNVFVTKDVILKPYKS